MIIWWAIIIYIYIHISVHLHILLQKIIPNCVPNCVPYCISNCVCNCVPNYVPNCVLNRINNFIFARLWKYYPSVKLFLNDVYVLHNLDTSVVFPKPREYIIWYKIVSVVEYKIKYTFGDSIKYTTGYTIKYEYFSASYFLMLWSWIEMWIYIYIYIYIIYIYNGKWMNVRTHSNVNHFYVNWTLYLFNQNDSVMLMICLYW